MTTITTISPEPLLTPGEVAQLFRVHRRTVTRWAMAGKLPALRTIGGHRRYREADIRPLLASVGTPTSTTPSPAATSEAVQP